MFTDTFNYSDILILRDFSGSMSSRHSVINDLFDAVFAQLPIGSDQHRVAFHAIDHSSYRNGWGFNSNYSYIISSSDDIMYPFPADTYTGMYLRLRQNGFFTDVKSNLLDPYDRPGYANIVFVIADGTYVQDASNAGILGR